jgi:O-antigen/teichoic acid export membrane protein
MLKYFNSQNIKVSAMGSLGIKFLSAFFAFLSSVLLARLLGIEGFGIYVLAFTTVTMLSIPVALGLPLLIIRYISKYEVEKNHGAIKGLLIRSNQIVIISTLIIVFAAFLLYLIWWKNLNSILVETIWYSFILLPLLALGSLRAAALRGMRYIILGQLPDTLLRNFLLCLGIYLCYLLQYKLTPQLAMILNIIAAAISYMFGYYFLKNKLLNRINKYEAVFFNKEWLKQAIPFSINSGVQIIKSKLITYILAIFGSIEAVTIFDVATRGASLVAFSLDGLNSAIAPYISKAFEDNNMNNLQNIITKTSRIIFVFALPVVVIFIFGGEALINNLFSKAYADAYIPLIVLCLGQLVNAATGSVGLVLNMTGKQVVFTKINVYITLLNVLFSIPLVIYFDVTGGAILFSLILIIQNGYLVFYVKKELNINTTIF